MTLEVNGRPAVAGKPTEGVFNLPPVLAEAIAAVNTAAGDPRDDDPAAPLPAMRGYSHSPHR